MPKVLNTTSARLLAMSSVIVFSLAGCTTDSESVVRSEDTRLAPKGKLGEDVFQKAPLENPSVSYLDRSIDELLAERAESYRLAEEQIVARGVINGALRGALFGLLIDAQPATLVGGAIVGGVIGNQIGEAVASQVIQDNRNYLVQRWSLEAVLDAVGKDSENTKFDLLLAERFVSVTASKGMETSKKESALVDLKTFQRYAAKRRLSLAEVTPVYADDPTAHDKLIAELDRQQALSNKLNAVVKSLEALK